MDKVKIIGVGEYLPGKPISNNQMEKVFGIKSEWIELVLGNKSRHFAIDLEKNKISHTLVDMSVLAAEKAMKHGKTTKDEIDLLILSTATSDKLMPASVNVIAERLGMNNIATFQIQTGCAGCVQAFQLAKSLLSDGSYRRALVISADTTYKFLDLERDFTEMPPDEMVNIALFGDGAGASVIAIGDDQPGLELVHIVNRLEGLDRDPGHILDWEAVNGNKQLKNQNDQMASEDYKAIENNVPLMTDELIEELLDIGEKNKEEIEFFLPPQLGGNMTNDIIKNCELDIEKCINRVKNVGNTGNSTPYFQFVEVWDKLKQGDDVLLITIESSKWIKTGVFLNYN